KVNQCAAGSAGDGCRLNDVNNLLAVVNGGLLYLQSREGIDTSRIGVIGASFGANLAYVAAGTFPEIDAAVALSPNARPVSGGLLGEGIVGFKAPHAILFAADGTEGPDAQTVAAKAEQPVEVKVYSPGKAHGVELLNNPQAAADVLAWLQAHL